MTGQLPYRMKSISLAVLIGIFLLAACSTPSVAPTVLSPTETQAEATNTSHPPTPEPSQTPEATTTPSGPSALAPEPQTVEFTTSDGVTLKGTYYPASTNPSPVIVLMHWIAGDENDWEAIAYWLQNRGLGKETAGSEQWLDSSWFPVVPEGFSVGVFTFTFRGCEGGCKGYDLANWLLDAQAAVKTAAGLEGVDPKRVITAGASIGADGATDGCQLFNVEAANTCQGSLALSPGSYLTLPFSDVVGSLEKENPAKPVWCFASKGDIDSANACAQAGGEHYLSFIREGREHGMELIRPTVEPSVLEKLIEFIQMSVFQ